MSGATFKTYQIRIELRNAHAYALHESERLRERAQRWRKVSFYFRERLRKDGYLTARGEMIRDEIHATTKALFKATAQAARIETLLRTVDQFEPTTIQLDMGDLAFVTSIPPQPWRAIHRSPADIRA